MHNAAPIQIEPTLLPPPSEDEEEGVEQENEDVYNTLNDKQLCVWSLSIWVVIAFTAFLIYVGKHIDRASHITAPPSSNF